MDHATSYGEKKASPDLSTLKSLQPYEGNRMVMHRQSYPTECDTHNINAIWQAISPWSERASAILGLIITSFIHKTPTDAYEFCSEVIEPWQRHQNNGLFNDKLQGAMRSVSYIRNLLQKYIYNRLVGNGFPFCVTRFLLHDYQILL